MMVKTNLCLTDGGARAMGGHAAAWKAARIERSSTAETIGSANSPAVIRHGGVQTGSQLPVIASRFGHVRAMMAQSHTQPVVETDE